MQRAVLCYAGEHAQALGKFYIPHLRRADINESHARKKFSLLPPRSMSAVAQLVRERRHKIVSTPFYQVLSACISAKDYVWDRMNKYWIEKES